MLRMKIKMNFFNNSHKISQIESENLILGGDFNKILNPELDRRGGSTKITNSALIINSFLENAEWYDVWRVTHDNMFQFTWRRQRVMSRLDYFFVPIGTFNKVHNYTILPA